MTKKGANVANWSSEAVTAFQKLKDGLLSKPCLRHPDPTRAFIVEVDASDVGIEAVISQADSYSIWLEVITVFLQTFGAIITVLQQLFAVHGLPDTIVSNNRSDSTFDDFKNSVQVSFPRKLHLQEWQNQLPGTEKCPLCQEELCPPLPPSCLAGRVRGRCGCCWACAAGEGQPCDLPQGRHVYGRCGDGMECLAPEGELAGSARLPAPSCVCSSRQPLCGTDRNTYRNSCHFREAAGSGRKQNLAVAHMGPCNKAPVIVSPPQDIVTLEGHDIIFGCEVSSYPVAFLRWRKEGGSGFLPGDDSHIAIQARGGPQRYAITGWLQIQEIQKQDEGLYTCYSRNEFGQASASARLWVVPPDSPLAVYVQTRHVGIFDTEDDEEEELEEGSTDIEPKQKE
ncbi:kazal-type serine protease inhibitor domain-containing protein 1-like [Rhinatrema bivittatum]|uniref:kazal-type serine protease inhibitor domain-containing protein 1-like n=1 Tax=Rhinatrema bivittatum TaxID=194408 RepID=UPI0011263CA1|nr:kazal-type serine protease inhibitor domain-containing protein 1-like [Rhinatrema bivittatum]